MCQATSKNIKNNKHSFEMHQLAHLSYQRKQINVSDVTLVSFLLTMNKSYICHLKGCVRNFLTNFYFPPNDSPFKNYVRSFLFHLKSSFLSRDIRFFVFPSFPLFLSVSHCFRAWSKINLEVYDVIICRNKNLFKSMQWHQRWWSCFLNGNLRKLLK